MCCPVKQALLDFTVPSFSSSEHLIFKKNTQGNGKVCEGAALLGKRPGWDVSLAAEEGSEEASA